MQASTHAGLSVWACMSVWAVYTPAAELFTRERVSATACESDGVAECKSVSVTEYEFVSVTECEYVSD